MLLHHASDGRMRPGGRETLDLIDEIPGGQLAGAGLGEIGQPVDAGSDQTG
jgi:hypothetical protein